ncbi:MAG: hypothetical protein FWB75_01400 [Oscillospiraceae bacterium]|nr:hypothetical protein [Oscillospiraceae bacterium]
MHIHQHKFLEILFSEHYLSLLRHALSVLQDEHLAENAVQETFLIACEKIDMLFSHPNPAGALRLTLVNVIKRIQANQNKKRMVPIDSLKPETLSTVDEVDLKTMYGNIVSSDELELIEKLYIKKYTYEELADELGEQVSTISMRVKRAKEKFRKNFAEQ